MYFTTRMAKEDKFAVGNLIILNINKTIEIPKGQTASKRLSSGKGKIYKVKRGDDICVEIVDIFWENGERDVRVKKVKGPLELRRLERGALRIGVRNLRGNKYFLELRQARVKENKWSNVFKATKKQLDEGSGLNSSTVLKRAGAIEIRTKEELFGTKDKTSTYLCAIFPKSAILFPTVSFVLTRVLPILNNYPSKA